MAPKLAPAPKHTMADWLALHEVEASKVIYFLDERAPLLLATCATGKHDLKSSHDLSIQAAWTLCAQALLTQTGTKLSTNITFAHEHTRIVTTQLPKGGPRALTVPNGTSGAATVTCPFDGAAKDLLTLAHEFGHAVQIAASGKIFMPPALRETCAFAAEIALLNHLDTADSDLRSMLRNVWKQETLQILNEPLAKLRMALEEQSSPYDYQWNYPIARCIQSQTAELCDLFNGRLSLAKLLR